MELETMLSSNDMIYVGQVETSWGGIVISCAHISGLTNVVYNVAVAIASC